MSTQGHYRRLAEHCTRMVVHCSDPEIASLADTGSCTRMVVHCSDPEIASLADTGSRLLEQCQRTSRRTSSNSRFSPRNRKGGRQVGRLSHHGSTPTSVITMHHKKKASIVNRNARNAIIAAPMLPFRVAFSRTRLSASTLKAAAI
jgi:hypothetical protein